MIRGTHCDTEFSGPARARAHGRPLVLNQQKWNGILKHLHRGEEEQALNEQERSYNEYLREESRAMTRKWENSLEKIRETKTEERLKREQEKIVEGEKRYQKLKENDENKRMEQIKRAQATIEKLKPGSKQLESAYVLSEVLQSREMQAAEKANYMKSKKEHEDALEKQEIIQTEQWQENHCQKMMDDKKRKDTYKRQLFEHIEETENRVKDKNKKRLDIERREWDAVDQELKSQMEKERFMLDKKRESMRKNALEAMRISEQRRLRIKMENEIENKIISIFGKENEVKNIKKENEKKAAEVKDKLRQLIATKLRTKLEEREQMENEIYDKAVAENDLKFTKIEQSKLELSKKIKAARIQQYIDDMKQKKKLKQQEKEEKQWEMANLFKNREVDAEFDRQKKVEHVKKNQATRDILMKQIEERKNRVEMSYGNKIDEDNASDDKHFFEYADQLLNEAKFKKRPVYPILKAIETYKKNNNLNDQREDLPHMKTNINVGLGDPIKYDITELKEMNSGHHSMNKHSSERMNHHHFNRNYSNCIQRYRCN